jgi:hypothetical protein
MEVPVFLQIEWVDEQGNLTPPAALFLDLLNRAMEGALSDNGWTVPQINLFDLSAIAGEMPDGTMWYVTDGGPAGFVGKVSGSLMRFDMSAFP